MRLRLHNIGPIRTADVRFTGLTVLVGENGTGKTTLTSVSYAAGLAWSEAYQLARRKFRFSPQPLQDADAIIESFEEDFRDRLNHHLRRCVNRDLTMLGREFRKGKGAQPRLVISDGLKNGWSLSFKLTGDRFVLERSSSKYRRPVVDDEDWKELDVRGIERRYRRTFGRGTLMPRKPVYFPAARSGFMQAYDALTALVWGALGGGYFEEATVGAIPGTTADFLRYVAQLRAGDESTLRPAPEAFIEQHLIGGRIELADEGQPKSVSFKPSHLTQSWPIEHAATSAAEIAPIVLYLRHRASRLDSIFIDEPEAHFHPRSQLPLARSLVRMSEAIASVTIATHSEFLVSELSNALLESVAEQRAPIRLRVHEFVRVDPSDLREGVAVNEIAIDPKMGFEISQFTEVANETYEKSIDLFNQVHETE